ncbi:MAG TPA: nucleotidyl transferase AbiEii/AbiGii toxin family protein [Thermoanaerobaculia bacterium]
MNRIRTTLAGVAAALAASEIKCMVIGGMANIAWGSSRATRDVDFTVMASQHDASHIIEALGAQIAKLPPDLDDYLRDGVLPFIHASGVHVDLILSRHPYAELAIARAVTFDVEGTPVRFCTPEDLVLHKIISERDRDRSDVADLLRRRRDSLDREYLDPRVHELAVILERPELEERYRDALA